MIMGISKVAVMMSSYNGELYIEEQINSILDQIGVDVHLYIRDDGSSDKTKQILEKYSSLEEVYVHYGRHIGIGNSFMEILCSIPNDYDYYSFSDQDDIWEKDKLITAVSKIKGIEGNVLYASNLMCVDANNNSVGMKYDDDMLSEWSLLSVIQNGRCYGCTQVFSMELFSLVQCRQPTDEFLQSRLHDTWISISAAASGTIIFDMGSKIRYRRHGNNYTKFNFSRIDIWKSRFSKLIHEEKRNPRSKTAREVLNCYREYVEVDQDKELIYALAYPKRLSNRVALIKNRKRFTSVTKETDVWFIFKVFAGWV